MSDMNVTQRGPAAGAGSYNSGAGNYSGGDISTFGFTDINSNRQSWDSQNQSRTFTEKTSPDDDGKTVAYYAWNKGGASDKNEPSGTTVTSVQPKRNDQPVVGWLVCVEGNNFGQSFNLYCGKNFIGRSSDMDISLDDKTVSRIKHAVVVYEPKARMFFAQPGDSHELFYRNESVVLSSTELNDRDSITIGKTKLVFVPFCDEKFGWETE